MRPVTRNALPLRCADRRFHKERGRCAKVMEITGAAASFRLCPAKWEPFTDFFCTGKRRYRIMTKVPAVMSAAPSKVFQVKGS